MKAVVLSATLLMAGAPGHAQAAHRKQNQPTSRGSGSTSSKGSLDEPLNNIGQRLDAIESSLKRPGTDAEFVAIQKALTDLKHSSFLNTVLPALISFLAAIGGVFGAGFVNYRLQQQRLLQEKTIADEKADHESKIANAKAKQDRELAEKQSKLSIGNAVVDWKLKQLQLLYGPARALLGQSFGLYRQMNKVLERFAPDRFRFVKGEGDRTQNSEDGEVFQIRAGSERWERFRAILHIDQVYGRGYGVETYLDEIVSIGARIVTIIEQNAGYARPEEELLMGIFAKYLAHFAVLKHLHGIANTALVKNRAQSDTPNRNANPDSDLTEHLNVDVSAVFPTELHVLIEDGFIAIIKDIEQWREKAMA